MSLGFDAISALPFATSGPDTDVSVVLTGNSLTITIGSVGIIADAVTENLTANQVNYTLALITVNSILNLKKKEISLDSINSLVEGRFEIINRNPLKILDGAHNIDGFIKTLEDYEKVYSSDVTNLYLGFKNGKNIESIIFLSFP